MKRYQQKLSEITKGESKRHQVRGEEWELFKETVLTVVRKVFGMFKIEGSHVRMGSKWRDEEVMLLVKEMREVYVNYLQGRSVSGCKMYMRKQEEVKKVKEMKKKANQR